MRRNSLIELDGVVSFFETYEKSRSDPLCEIADELLESFSQHVTDSLERREFKKNIEVVPLLNPGLDLTTYLLSHDGPKPQEFIDALIMGFEQTEPSVQQYADALVSPFIAMYVDTRLFIDYTRLIGPEFPARDLQGTEEEPITVTYQFPEYTPEDIPWVVGRNAKHCQIELCGFVYHVLKAEQCTFFSEQPPNSLGKIKECTFYVTDARDFETIQSPGGDFYQNKLIFKSSTREHHGTIGYDFGMRGNRILIPDDDGGWKEVKGL